MCIHYYVVRVLILHNIAFKQWFHYICLDTLVLRIHCYIFLYHFDENYHIQSMKY